MPVINIKIPSGKLCSINLKDIYCELLDCSYGICNHYKTELKLRSIEDKELYLTDGFVKCEECLKENEI